MSTPAPPKHPGGVHPTRQQLDELDTLIQHMLTLPVNPPDNSAPGPGNTPPPPVVADKVPAGNGSPPRSLSGLPTVELPPTNDRAGRSGPSPSKEWPSLAPGTASGTLVESRPPADGLPVRETLEPSVKRLLSADSRDDESSAPPADPRGIATLLWGMLVWPNQVFDAFMMVLGRPGRWLSGRGGRALIGWTGLVLLAGAMVWGVLGWFGWSW